MNRFIIGGEGFIGSNILQAFHAVPIHHDLRTDVAGKLLMIHAGDIVFHTAHYGSVDNCARNPQDTRTVNVTGTKQFFAEVKKRGALPVYFSTNMVFNGDTALYSENDLPNPHTEYGRQKLEVEQYIENIFEEYVIIRMTKVYGTNSTSFFDSWIMSLREGQDITVVRDMYVAPIYIDDLMRSVEDALDNQVTGICHVAGPEERSMIDIAKLVVNHTGANEKLIRIVSAQELALVEKRSVHNSLACDTLVTQGYPIPRDIPEILRAFYS